MIYLVIDKATKRVHQIGLTSDSVVVEDPVKEELISLDREKPNHLSEHYFKVVGGKLIDMNAGEKTQADQRLKNADKQERVQRMKDLLAEDPAGFRAALGL